MKKFLSICALVVAAAALLIWFHLPIKTTATVELYCDDPNAGALYAEFDLRISRSLFAPPAVDGTIRIGDADYVPWGKIRVDFIRNMLRKVKGEINIPGFWVNPANYGQLTDKLMSDMLTVWRIQFGGSYTIEGASIVRNSYGYGWSGNAVAS